MRTVWLLAFFPAILFAHPGHEERGLLLAFLDHIISDAPSLIAAVLCAAVLLAFALRKRKAKK